LQAEQPQVPHKRPTQAAAEVEAAELGLVAEPLQQGSPGHGVLGTAETALGLQACVGMKVDPGRRPQPVPHWKASISNFFIIIIFCPIL